MPRWWPPCSFQLSMSPPPRVYVSPSQGVTTFVRGTLRGMHCGTCSDFQAASVVLVVEKEDRGTSRLLRRRGSLPMVTLPSRSLVRRRRDGELEVLKIAWVNEWSTAFSGYKFYQNYTECESDTRQSKRQPYPRPRFFFTLKRWPRIWVIMTHSIAQTTKIARICIALWFSFNPI